jgi:hypothetical protein
MRKVIFIFIALVLGIVIISCNKKDEPVKSGKVQFSVTGETKTTRKSATTLEQPAYILINVEDASGKAVYFHEKIELYSFNGSYLSKPVDLKPGDYKLTEFMVLDYSNQVIYATPKTGSAKEYLVNNPLDISFTINEDEVTKLTPEVLSAEELSPADFGYLDASFELVKTFDFLICVFVYNENLKNLELTTASLTVNNGTKDLYTLPLEAKTNQVTVNDGYSTYNLKVSKEGYTSYTVHLAVDSLKACYNKPLKVILNPGTDVDASLVAYYPFDGNANDESLNGNNGTIYHAELCAGEKDVPQSAYIFSGNDSKIIAGKDPVDANESVTFFASVFPQYELFDAAFDPHNNKYILSTGAQTGCSGYFILWNNGNFWLGRRTENWSAYSLVGSFNPYEWYKIAGVYNSSNKSFKVYINGLLINSEVDIEQGNYVRLFNDFYIGAPNTPYNSCFKGIIDEVRVYNRVLNEQEIQALNL